MLLAPPVWIFTFIKSKGWPTRTVQTPPTPPERNDVSAETESGFVFGGEVPRRRTCTMDASLQVPLIVHFPVADARLRAALWRCLLSISGWESVGMLCVTVWLCYVMFVPF